MIEQTTEVLLPIIGTCLTRWALASHIRPTIAAFEPHRRPCSRIRSIVTSCMATPELLISPSSGESN